MTDGKSEILFSIRRFGDALKRLEAALNSEESDLKADATIQRFEFTFELAWKTLKRVLLFEGYLCNSPRECLKEAFRFGLITEEEGWLDMLDDRNMMAHVYSEDEALKIFARNPRYSKTMADLIKEFHIRYSPEKR